MIESKHPELNPDHPSHRNDLIEQAVKRTAIYVKQGMSKASALERAVRDMEGEGRF